MQTKWDWGVQRAKKAFLALADGTIFRGYSIGANRDNVGEVVFNTGLTGYQEILTDPSYSGQIVTMTYPEIGNTGINEEDVESSQFYVNGFVVHAVDAPSNWRAQESLRDSLERRGVPALAGIDTRRLTAKLREQGTQKGCLAVEGRMGEREAVRTAREWCGLDGQDYAQRVSCSRSYRWDVEGRHTCSWGMADRLVAPDLRIVAFDFGIKWNILRSLRRSGMDVTVVPATTSAGEVLALTPDGVFFSNGPADPAAVTYAVTAARELLGKVPIMGICLGHQILGIACGGRTCRLKFGHHGCNHPVKDLETGKIEITSQNHNFTVDPDSLDAGQVVVTHRNLNDGTVEGLSHRKVPMFAVQYHPEAAPGPHDPYYLFTRFRDLIRKGKPHES